MSLLEILREADVFYDLTLEQLEQVAALCTVVRPPKGATVFRENSYGDEMYLIAAGSVEIEADPAILGLETDSGPTTLATLRRGQTFGEMALVDRGLRSATVTVAEEETVLLSIHREALMELCERDHQLGYRLMRNIAIDLACRVRGVNLKVRERSLRLG